jgi:hypothetical protein
MHARILQTPDAAGILVFQTQPDEFVDLFWEY